MKTLRSERQPDKALEAAAAALCTAMEALGCRIYSVNEAGELIVRAECGMALPEVVGAFSRQMISARQDEWAEHMPSAELLGVPLFQSEQASGAVWVWRSAEAGSWPTVDHELLTTCADHLGISLGQFDYERKLRVLSENDGLTGLYNRRTFMEKLTQELQGQTTSGAALFYIDLDNFKAVNDVHGHHRGDQVIKRVGELLRAELRADGMAGRLGGDEFVVWQPGLTESAARAMAEKLVGLAAKLAEYSAGADKKLGLSVGVALAHAGEVLRAQQLLDRADTAMYQVKHDGKSGWAVA